MSAAAIVIAHRGASGYLPEHTLESKALAYGLGADYLEQDVVATRDGALVVLHDLHLDDVTDVRERYPDRCRADGRHYVIDFDLAEVARLNVCERRESGTDRARFPARFPSGMRGLRIATLEQEIQLVQGMNRSTGRGVGIYPEIKHPAWHREHGVDLSREVLRTLEHYGYRTKSDPAFVQCFDAAELARIRRELGCGLRLIQLVGPEAEYAQLLTAEGVERVAAYADGLGPQFDQVGVAASGGVVPTELMMRAKASGLLVHAYTFRRDALPAYASSLDLLLNEFLGRVGLDGVFCDHPDVAVRARNRLAGKI
jgi:glycerophosphoryl diester phosphodiesterase